VDSILIDEARTPLIISGQGEKSSDLYVQVDKLVRTLSGGFDDELKDAEDAALVAMREEKKKNKKKKKAADYEEEEEEVVDYTQMTLEEQANYEAEQEEKRAAALAASPAGK